MKKLNGLLMSLTGLTMLVTGCTSSQQFVLSAEIYNNQQQQFIAHHGEGRFGSYLTMNINYAPMKDLFDQVAASYPAKLKSRGEAHVTVVTPPEYYDQLRSHLSMVEIDALAANIQSSTFSVVCLGRAAVEINQQQQSALFIVLDSPELLAIRQQIQALYVKKGGNAADFNPTHFYPHITLGFTARDLHESDGVIKDKKSCYAQLASSTID